MRFIHNHIALVHHNLIEKVNKRDWEGIRMALNQIHYGSLKKDKNLGKERHDNNREQVKKKARKDAVRDKNETLEFIKSNQYLIEPSIFHEAMLRNEKAISSALGVIHHKSLDGCLPPSSIGGKNKNGKSYKEALPESTFLDKPEVVFLPQSGQKKGAKINSPDNIDLDFLEIGFKKVLKAVGLELLPTRKSWLECRGLPIVTWTEDIFVKLISKWGRISQFRPNLEDDFYQQPIMLVETGEINPIDSLEEVCFEGQIFTIRFIERDWKEGSQHFQAKIKGLRDFTKRWIREVFENIYQKIKELEARQDKANNLYLDSKVKLDIRSELEEMYMIKSSMLCQSARAN
ncbi:hypothetical protein ACET3Z_018067 [Daucus carota]